MGKKKKREKIWLWIKLRWKHVSFTVWCDSLSVCGKKMKLFKLKGLKIRSLLKPVRFPFILETQIWIFSDRFPTSESPHTQNVNALKCHTDIAAVNIIHEMSSLIQVFRESSTVLIDSIISSAHIWASIDHYWCAQCFCVDQLLSVNKASVKSV